MKFITTLFILNFLQNFGYTQEIFNYEIQKNNSISVCSNPQTLQDSIFCAWYRSDTLEFFVKKFYDECPDSLKVKFKKSFGVDNFDSLILKQKKLVLKGLKGIVNYPSIIKCYIIMDIFVSGMIFYGRIFQNFFLKVVFTKCQKNK